MNSTIDIACLQHTPTPGSLEESLIRLEAAACEAKFGGASLLLVPEASMTGYNISLSLRDNIAEAVDGRLTQSVSAICRQHTIAISYGFIERSEQHYYNSVQLIDAAGQVVSHYRKTHLWGELDRRLFSAGDSFSPVVDVEGWKIGQLICYDVEFPEAVRHLALQGAELILVSTALMSPWTDVADHIVPARAYENQVFLAYANYCGSENGIEYVGHSCIAGPDGRSLSKAASDVTLLQATLDRQQISSIRSDLPYHRDRRPELYEQITMKE